MRCTQCSKQAGNAREPSGYCPGVAGALSVQRPVPQRGSRGVVESAHSKDRGILRSIP